MNTKRLFMLMQLERFQTSTVCLGESIKIFDYQEHLPGLDKEESASFRY